MPRFKFDKLVRDKIIDNQITSGAKPMFHVLSPTEHKQELVDKIVEEAKEIAQAELGEIAEEIAGI